MSFTIPSDGHATGDAGHVSDHNNIADMLTLAAGINARNTAYAGGAKGDGATDDTAAIQAALNAAVPGAAVFLPPTASTYRISSPLTIPAGVQLTGQTAYRACPAPVLKPTAGFAGTSAVAFAAGTPCGGIRWVNLDGSGLPAGTVDGIGCYTGCKQGSIIGVNVHHFTGHGININNTAATGNPDGWYLHEISAHDNGGSGIFWDYAVDGQLDLAHLDHNAVAGLAVGTMNNTTFSHVKAQQNTQYGYACTGGFVKSNSTFTACMSENNNLDGWHLNVTTGGGQGALTLQGCSARDDGVSGTSGSGYSGFWLNGKNCDLLLAGCSAYITASAAGPDYGLQLSGCLANVVIGACSLIGSVAAFHDGGGNTGTIQWGRNTLAAGQSDATRTLAYSDNGGTATFSGTGAVTAFTITHKLAGTPSSWSVTAASAAANGSQFTTASATQLTTTFAAAPVSGANNVVLAWQARL